MSEVLLTSSASFRTRNIGIVITRYPDTFELRIGAPEDEGVPFCLSTEELLALSEAIGKIVPRKRTRVAADPAGAEQTD